MNKIRYYRSFVLKCGKKHVLREFPLDNIKLCGLCIENHSTKNFSKLKELQVKSMEEAQGIESLRYMEPRRSWQPRFPDMPQNLPQQFTQQIPQNYQYPAQSSWNYPMPWKAWPPQQIQNQPPQSWRGYSYGTQPQQFYPQQPYQQQYQLYPQWSYQSYPQQPFPYQQSQ